MESLEPERNQQLEILSIEEPLLPQILKRLGRYKDSNLIQKLLRDELYQLSRPQYVIESKQDVVSADADNAPSDTPSDTPITSAHGSSMQLYSKSTGYSVAGSLPDMQKEVDPNSYIFPECSEFPPQSTSLSYPNPQDQVHISSTILMI